MLKTIKETLYVIWFLLISAIIFYVFGLLYDKYIIDKKLDLVLHQKFNGYEVIHSKSKLDLFSFDRRLSIFHMQTMYDYRCVFKYKNEIYMAFLEKGEIWSVARYDEVILIEEN